MCFLLIVDTENYAGNFERELCAWATGRIGDCGVGRPLAEQAWKEMTPELCDWTEDGGISSEPDEHGCWRPVATSQTPGIEEFQSVEIYLGKRPPEHLFNEMVERIRYFCAEHKPGGVCAGRVGDMCQGPLTLTRVRLVARKVVTTDTVIAHVEA